MWHTSLLQLLKKRLVELNAQGVDSTIAICEFSCKRLSNGVEELSMVDSKMAAERGSVVIQLPGSILDQDSDIL